MNLKLLRFVAVLIVLVLVVAVVATLKPPEPPADPDALHLNPFAEPADSNPPGHSSAYGDIACFPDSQLITHPDLPLDPDKNVIWCGILPLAWNEMIGLLGDKLHYAQPTPEAELLNRQEFTKADLDEPSYLAMADKGDQASAHIRAALQKKFGSTFDPSTVPDPDPGNMSYIAYACLYKLLAFPSPFYTNINPLTFDGKPVRGFGFKPDMGPELRSQVSVLSYVSDDNFVIRLKLKDEHDQLILAKIPPGKTLQATIESVLPLKEKEVIEWGVGDHDELAIPNIDFDLATDFAQLEGPLTSGLDVAKVHEDVLFQLNQSGIKLKAYAAILALSDGGGGPPPPPAHLIFNKPFLVLLKRDSSLRPYFAMWVGNPTVLIAP